MQLYTCFQCFSNIQIFKVNFPISKYHIFKILKIQNSFVNFSIRIYLYFHIYIYTYIFLIFCVCCLFSFFVYLYTMFF